MPGKFTRNSTLAVALALGVALGGGAFVSDAAYAQAKGKKGAAQGPSPEFQAAAAPLQQIMDQVTPLQGRADTDPAAKAQIATALAGAPALLARAEAAAKTPFDRLLASQYAFNLGLLSNNVALAERGARGMLATKLLNPEQTTQIQGTLTKLSSLPKTDPVLDQVNAQMQAKNPQAALAELRRAESSAPGGRPPASWLARATQIAVNSNLANDALYWSTRQVELYPNNLNWLTAAQVTRKYGQLDPQESVDLYRLMARSGALNHDPKTVAFEYQSYAEAALSRGLYGEAVRVVDQGIAAGALQPGGRIGQIRSGANARLASDRASLASQERDARGRPDGIAALSIADAYLNYGDLAKAEEFYQLALQKGKIDRDRALNRLGIVQFDQGKYAEARASFAQVGGRRKAVAQLWQTLVRQKSPAAG